MSGRGWLVITVVDDEELLIGKAAVKFGAQKAVIHTCHRKPPQVLMHLGVGARTPSRDIDLRHEREVIGTVRSHGLDEGEERLARGPEVAMHLGEQICIVEAITFVGQFGSLDPGVEYLGQSHALEELASP